MRPPMVPSPMNPTTLSLDMRFPASATAVVTRGRQASRASSRAEGGVVRKEDGGGPSALLEEAIDVGCPHPDEVLLQPAMRVDPGLDVGAVRGPQRCGRGRKFRLMEPERGARRHADVFVRDVPEQHRAGRLARADNAYVHATRRQSG